MERTNIMKTGSVYKALMALAGLIDCRLLIKQSARVSFLALGIFFEADRCVSLDPKGDLTSQLQLATLLDEKRDLVGMELSLEQQGEAAMWTIMHSTLPGRVGQSLLPASCTLNSLASSTQAGIFGPKGGWQLLPAQAMTCI